MANKIAVSSYSFHDLFRSGDPSSLTVQGMIDKCVEYGVDGIELMIQHLEADKIVTSESQAGLAQYAALRGIRLVGIGASHNPVQTSAELQDDELAKLLKAIDYAHNLGIPFVRALGGLWGTSSSFQDLLDNDGEDTPIEGFTNDDAYGWAIDALTAGAQYAGERGITLLLENHWGLTGTAAGAARIHDGVNSPWLKFVIDTGNFVHRPDQYAEMEIFATDLGMLHAKVYKGGGKLITVDVDYPRVFTMLQRIGFSGYVSIEFEGNAEPEDGILDGIATVHQAMAAVAGQAPA